MVVGPPPPEAVTGDNLAAQKSQHWLYPDDVSEKIYSPTRLPVCTPSLCRRICRKVDSHGQSEVAFAFCALLGFDLLPRLKVLHRQKLSRPESSQPAAYPNLPYGWFDLDLTKRLTMELLQAA